MIIDILKKSNKSKIWKFIFTKIIGINLSDLIFPKILLFKFKDFDFEIKNFYDYAKNNPQTKFMNNKNEVYQSNHDIEKKTEFKNLKKEIENFLNEKLKNKIFRKPTFGKFKLKSMWFVIMKKNSTHDMHTHPKSAFTGVIYFKVNKNEISSALKVLIPNLNQNLYKMSHVNEEVLNKKTKLININNIETELYDKKIFNFVPDNKDMIIFNSYMMHGIDKYVSNEDRIALAWDAVYTI